MSLALSGNGVFVVAVPVLVVLAGLLLLGVARRRQTELAIGYLNRETRRADRSRTGRSSALERPRPLTGRDVERAAEAARRVPSTEIAPAESRLPTPWVAPDAETIEVTRRQFLNRSIVDLMGFGIVAFGLATLGFLWPSTSGGFGSKLRVGAIAEIRQKIADGGGFAYYPEGRMWITEYPADALDKARAVYGSSVLAAMEEGLAVMYQRCPHLGCRVPPCLTSQWFECPCHGSQYNRAGEKKAGPAPRGMDRFATVVEGDRLTVDTGIIIQGPPIGTNTTGQEAEGPHCVGGGE